MPGMEDTSVFSLLPSIINRGNMRLDALRCVSCTISRITADLRFLLGLISIYSLSLLENLIKTQAVDMRQQTSEFTILSRCLIITFRNLLVIQSKHGFCQPDFVG